MLVCYALEQRSRRFILVFAFACALGSIYAFLQGAWPFWLSRSDLVYCPRHVDGFYLFDGTSIRCYIFHNMIYLKGLSKIIFVVALMALGNSLIVQPALELRSNHVATHEQDNCSDESSCCFICHPAHFQWIANTASTNVHRINFTSFVTHSTPSSVPDPRIGSIFRPPVAL